MQTGLTGKETEEMSNSNAKKVKNPLIKRIPREFLTDWRKYLVVTLFFILAIGFVSGMYVANGSMLKAAREGKDKYKLEYGHFELKNSADDSFISALQSGEKADVRQYYTDKTRKEFDEKFDGEFEKEFKKEFDEKFTEEFDKSFSEEFEKGFNEQVKTAILAQIPDEATAEPMINAAIEQAKQSGEYRTAYDNAYEEARPKAYEDAYKKAYDEAYPDAYNEAWLEVEEEINEKYEEAEKKFKLEEKGFEAIPVKIYENFFKNCEEDNNNDGVQDGNVRVFPRTDDINSACLLEGELPHNEKEIAVDRMHADNVNLKVGDEISVGGE